MQLINSGEFVADSWTDHSAEGAFSASDLERDAGTDALVSWDLVGSIEIRAVAAGRSGRVGVRIANDVDVAEVVPILDHASLIAIDFPSSGDGRGFSLARRLRQAGFRGELRASGPLIADQYAFAIACGFDTVEIPDELAARQPAGQWRRAQGEVARMYQPGYRTLRSVLEARHPAPFDQPAKIAAARAPSSSPTPAVHPPPMAEAAWWAHW